MNKDMTKCFLYPDGLLGMAIVGGATVVVGGLVGLGVALLKKWQWIFVYITCSFVNSIIYIRIQQHFIEF